MRKVFGIAIVAAVMSMAGAGIRGNRRSWRLGGMVTTAAWSIPARTKNRRRAKTIPRPSPRTFVTRAGVKRQCQSCATAGIDGGSGYETLSKPTTISGLCLIGPAAKDPQATFRGGEQGRRGLYPCRPANAGFGGGRRSHGRRTLSGWTPASALIPLKAGKHGRSSIRTTTACGLVRWRSPDIAPDTLARLNAALAGAKRTEAHMRANSWTPSAEAADR